MKVYEAMGSLAPLEGEIGIEVELESETRRPPFVAKYWNLVGDGSLRGMSGEYVLYSPLPRGEVKAAVDYLKKSLDSEGVVIKPSFRASTHVHVNCQELTLLQVKSFCTAYYLFEEVLLGYVGGGRGGNMFCLSSSSSEQPMHILSSALKKKNLSILGVADIRYSALNLAALYKFGSLEFRALLTEEKLDNIVPWVGMLTAIKDFAVSVKNPQDILNRVSGDGLLETVKRVFGDYSEVLSSQDDFTKKMYTGIWCAQDLAFDGGLQ